MDVDNGAGGRSNFVVVDSGVPEAGMITWWRLSGHLSLEALKAEWEARDLPGSWLPTPTTEAVALRRAVRELSDGRTLVRPLEHRQGWGVVFERAEGDQLSYEQGLTAKMNGVGPAFEPHDHPAVPKIRAAYDAALGTVTQEDASSWLSGLMPRVDAVPLRDTGGVYFVPRHALGTWRKVIRALSAVSGHSVLGAPAMPADETFAAVIDAVTAEALGECEAIERQVREGDLGERALGSRMQRSDQMEAKLSRYEEIVGVKLDGVREHLERLRAAIVSAQLAAAPQMEIGGVL